MKKIQRMVWLTLCIMALGLFAMPLQASAGNMISGTLGDNGGVQWTYDRDTKTLTVTGEDSGVYGGYGNYYNPVFKECSDARKVVVKDCTLHGNASALFIGLPQVESIVFDNFDTSNVTNMSHMFDNCTALTDLDVSGFDTTNVTNMSGMFVYCSSLTTLNVSGFDTSNVADMSGMFSGCTSLTDLDVSGFDTSNVTSIYSMFQGCSSLAALDVSGFDTSNVIYMSGMFQGCKSLTTLDVSGFDTSNVTYIHSMFLSCESLTALDVSGFDTSNVTGLHSMFEWCESLEEVDVSGFDTSNVTSMYSMFRGCESLTYLDVSSFDTSNVTNMSDMFNWCEALDILKTFKVMSEGMSVELPGEFMDSKDNKTTTLTIEFCNETLRRVREVPVSAIVLNVNKISLETGKNYQLQATVTPDNATNKIVTWKSSNTTVATVDANGKVTAMAPGTTTITATAADGSGVSASCSVTVNPAMSEQERQVRAFVERMYTVALGRASDPSGIDYWAEQLLSHQKDGAGISEGFIMSEEFASRNYSNEEYLKVLYRTFFNRESDEGGMSFWMSEMSAGRSRKSVLAGFVNSKEFTEICESYGINRGTMEDDATATGAGQFVERLYTIALERASDPVGLEDWAQRINNKTNTPEQVAKEFFLSPEYAGKNTSNDKYVETLYLVFMDRASEAGGKAYWVGQLEQGMSREAVLEGFAQSEEFKEIMARYGL